MEIITLMNNMSRFLFNLNLTMQIALKHCEYAWYQVWHENNAKIEHFSRKRAYD